MKIAGRQVDDMADERLSWEEITEKYPDQWVGLVDVVNEENNYSTIESAVVKYTGMSKSELTHMQIVTKGKVIARYTNPNGVFHLGAVEIFG